MATSSTTHVYVNKHKNKKKGYKYKGYKGELNVGLNFFHFK